VTRKVDVRIVAATNRNLREEAAAGRFEATCSPPERLPIVLPRCASAPRHPPLATHFVEQAASPRQARAASHSCR
jgi:transcriptional regulator with GAF, ATPase, and Fis domain